MARLLDHPLRSRVGQRIALVVLVSAILPLTAIGSLLFARARGQVETQERARLHEQTKSAALNGLERLFLLEQRLRWFASDERHRAIRPSELSAVLGSFDDLDALAIATASSAEPQLVRGATPPPLLAPDALEVVGRGGAVLVADDETPSYWLFSGAESNTGAFAAARVPTASVFGFGDNAALSDLVVLCVLDAKRRVVACSDGGAIVRQARWAASLPTHGSADVTVNRVIHRAQTWALPLEHQYRAGVWTIALIQSRSESSAALDRFAREVVLLSALSLIVVILAVLATLRRSLAPLEQLEAAAARVAQHDFDLELHIDTRDEFEELAHGFNGMVGELRQRFEALEAFSVGTATSLARTIDAKSPWTAGHSERVSELAVAIAEAMGLPASQIDILALGGLLHDIGKLATPQELLEKAGPLTVEEERIVQAHPGEGARILEPIPTFAPLLPIVLQHHERFDGSGYPAGLAGEDIHILARVLAVADVFDALRSDRPYRQGWPLADVIAHIQASAGSHFDPRVVEVFVRVMTLRASEVNERDERAA